MAGSRRLGDEIHPWPANGDLRPETAVHDFQRECLVSNRVVRG